MSKKRAQELIDLGNRLFSKKTQYDNLCQEIAWQYCPDLGSFTTPIVLGDDWASDRMDSFPELISRELSSQLGAMLRPQDKPWFRATTLDDDMDADESNARGLQYISSVMRRGLYDPRSKFIRSTKEGDRFYVNFGQCVISAEEDPNTRSHLYFQNHHIKNCSWLENNIGEIDHLHRKDKMSGRALVRHFPSSKLHNSIKEAADKDPGREFQTRVVVMPSDEYDSVKMYSSTSDGKKSKLPFVAIYIDVENQMILKESGLPAFVYIVPRWLRFSDSQYAFSPAAMTALADARMAQMLSQIILEAGEKAVDPPMIGKQDVVIGEPNIMSGGISWVDMEHDQSLKDALDVINISADMRVGFEMRRDIRDMLTKAFYIDKLALPPMADRTTAYEMAQRLEEHVRNLLPLFEPMQIEYNTRILDLSFSLLKNMKKFDWDRVPQELLGTDFTWGFESPIQRAQETILVEQFKASLEIMAAGLQGGATSKPLIIDKAMRDAIRGVGGPASWRKTVEEQEADKQQMESDQMVQKAIGELHAGASAASVAGDAANKLGIQPSADKMMAAIGKGGGVSQGITSQQQEEEEPIYSIVGNSEDEDSDMQQQLAQGSPSMPVPLNRQASSIEDLMRMQYGISRQLSDIAGLLKKPRKIKIERGADGKIASATAAHE